jgi:DNA-binding FrmR family transcriptional regulator
MHGYAENKDAHLRRLRRIDGQVRGLQRMIENDEYCIDVLTQLSSATAALQGVAIGLVDEHLRHCVMDAAAESGAERDAKLSEAVRAVERLVRS